MDSPFIFDLGELHLPPFDMIGIALFDINLFSSRGIFTIPVPGDPNLDGLNLFLQAGIFNSSFTQLDLTNDKGTTIVK